MSATPGTTPGYASRWRRFSSMMYEGVLLFGVVFVASYLFDTLTQSTNAMMLRHGRQAAVFIAIGIYFVLCWRLRGQTLPMKTWDMRLVDLSGQTPTLARAIVRYVAAWILPLLGALAVLGATRATGHASTDLLIVFAPFAHFLWSWFDREGHFLHDRIAGTRIILLPSERKRARTRP